MPTRLTVTGGRRTNDMPHDPRISVTTTASSTAAAHATLIYCGPTLNISRAQELSNTLQAALGAQCPVILEGHPRRTCRDGGPPDVVCFCARCPGQWDSGAVAATVASPGERCTAPECPDVSRPAYGIGTAVMVQPTGREQEKEPWRVSWQ
jgi:hypothetical protein